MPSRQQRLRRKASQGQEEGFTGAALSLRAPLTIHFGGQANLFDSGRRQEKAALVSTKADSPSLPECKNLLLDAQKQLLELPLSVNLMSLPN
jgi:hypothetical protein